MLKVNNRYTQQLKYFMMFSIPHHIIREKNKMETSSLLHRFLAAYDPEENFSFREVKFRPGAKRTTKFGVDVDTPSVAKLRIHPAIDSAQSNRKNEEWTLYSPFRLRKAEFIDPYPNKELQDAFGFGSLLFLYTPFGFHLRIAHIPKENLEDTFLEAINNEEHVNAKEFLGYIGNYGKSTGRHAHVECVSDKREPTILDELLDLKYPNGEHKEDYTKEQLQQFYKQAGLTESEGDKLYQKERERRGVSLLNPYVCFRKDYHTKEMRTFYNTLDLFGM